MLISTETSSDNPNYMGYDENSDGEWGDYYMCPNPECEPYCYLEVTDSNCPLCGIELEWNTNLNNETEL